MAIWRARVVASAIPALFLTLASCSGGSIPEKPAGSKPPPPLAAFSATPTQGIAPLQVSFTNLSNNSTKWLWEFGDGSVSTEQDPVHVYAAASVYSVRLTAVGADQSTDVEEAVDLVRAEDAVGDGSFEGQTAGSPPAAPWEIVAGNSHVIQPLPGVFGDHGMPSAGARWCELSGEGSDPTDGPQVVGIQQAIHPPLGEFVLQFEAAFVNGEGVPDSGHNDFMRVEVSDGATTEILYARDTFAGMLSTSAVHNRPMTPVETVTADLAALFPGSSSDTPFVLRALVGNGGDGQFPSFGYVDAVRFHAAAAEPIQTSFTVDPKVAGVGFVIKFTDTSSGSPKSWSWDFGDGTASTEQKPKHSYLAVGDYKVTLTAVAPGAGSTDDEIVTIDNSPCEQGALQIVSPPSGCGATSDEFTFENDSVNGTSYTWDFGDGNTLTTTSTANVTHTYSAAGTYSVTVTAFGPCSPKTGNVSSPETAQIVDAPDAGSLDIFMTFPFGTNVSCKPPGFSSFANEAAYRGETVHFEASNSNPGANPLAFSWNFGDGGTGSGAEVDHVYTSATSGSNKRTVILTASNCAGSAQISRTIKIIQLGSTALAYLNAGGAAKCATCHSGGAPAGGLDLTPANAFNQLVGVNGVNMNCTTGGFNKRVNTSCGANNANSAVSGLINSMSAQICSAAGSMNFLCGNCVNSTQLEELVDWIDFGAPNN